MLYVLLCILLKPLLLLLVRPRIYGNRRALSTKGGVIFVANHISMLDPVLLVLISPRIIHFMAKKEIFRSPFGKIFFDLLNVFPVDRGIPDIKSIKRSLHLLQKGKAFGIFPEGRRAVTDDMDELELGTALIAMRSGAPVVPIYIRPDSYRRLRPAVIVGDPLYAEDTRISASRRENEVLFMQRMSNTMVDLKKRLNKICK